jgi:hypothetical protein
VSPAKISPMLLLATMLLATVMASGCTGAGSGTYATATPGIPGAETQQATSPDAIVLTVNGSVNNPLQLTLADLEACPSIPVNLSAAMPGSNGNLSGRANRTLPAGAEGNWQPGESGNLSPGSSEYHQNGGGMPPGTGGYYTSDGGIPPGASGYYTSGSEPVGVNANAANQFSRGNSSRNVTGISLNGLLDKANPSGSATNVTFLGMGGRVVQVPLSDIRANADAVIIAGRQGMLETIVSGMSGDENVIGLTGIILT